MKVMHMKVYAIFTVVLSAVACSVGYGFMSDAVENTGVKVLLGILFIFAPVNTAITICRLFKSINIQ